MSQKECSLDSEIGISRNNLELDIIRGMSDFEKFSAEDINASTTLIFDKDLFFYTKVESTIIDIWNENNNQKISKIEDLSLVDLLIILEKIKDQWNFDSRIGDIINRLITMIDVVTSITFYVLYQSVENEFPWEVSILEVYNLYEKDKSILLNEEFWYFCFSLWQELWIKRKSLNSDVYLFNALSDWSDIYVNLLENYKKFVHFFPEVPQNNLFLRYFLDFLEESKQSDFNWENMRNNYKKLIFIYGTEFIEDFSEYQWSKLINNLQDNQQVEFLSSSLSIELWNIIQKYPNLVDEIWTNINDFFREHNEWSKYILFFEVIPVSPSEFEYLLLLWWLDLVAPQLLYEHFVDEIPKDLDKLLEWDWFENNLNKLFSIISDKKANISIYDWIELCNAYLKLWNLDKIIELNKLFMQANINWFDFSGKNIDAKITVLKQFLRLWLPFDEYDWSCQNICIIWNSIKWSPYLVDSWKALNSSEISEAIEHKDFPMFLIKIKDNFKNIVWETDLPDIVKLFVHILHYQ